MENDLAGTARETTVDQLSELDYGWVVRLPLPRIEPIPDDERYRVRPVRPVTRAFGGELIDIKVVRTYKGNMPVDKYVLQVMWLGSNRFGQREIHLSELLPAGSPVFVVKKYVKKQRHEVGDNPFASEVKRKARPARKAEKRPSNLVWSSEDSQRKR